MKIKSEGVCGAHYFDPNTQKAETGGTHRFEASLGYRVSLRELVRYNETLFQNHTKLNYTEKVQ